MPTIREPIPGWCENIPGVLGQPHWPGRLIYKLGREFEDRFGNVRRESLALCPACGLWVDVRPDDTIPAHKLPGGTNRNRADKRRLAEDEYGALVAEDRLRAAAVA